jgi:hypothetical protein
MMLQLKSTHYFPTIFADPYSISTPQNVLPAEVRNPKIPDNIRLIKTDHPTAQSTGNPSIRIISNALVVGQGPGRKV